LLLERSILSLSARFIADDYTLILEIVNDLRGEERACPIKSTRSGVVWNGPHHTESALIIMFDNAIKIQFVPIGK
jgi:hypothetical protein